MDSSKERGFGVVVAQVPGICKETETANPHRDPGDKENYNQEAERPICYLSKRLNKHEMNYWPTELEVAGLVWTVKKTRHFIDDAPKIFAFTDHIATVDIVKQENFRHAAPHRQNLRLVRASLFLSQFKDKLTVVYVPGDDNANKIPDALSRLQASESEEEKEKLDNEDDIYESLMTQAKMVRMNDDLIDSFQRGYAEDPFLRTKFSDLKRRFAKLGVLPVSYNNLLLEDAEVAVDNLPKPRLPGDRRFLVYLNEKGGKLRLCIPKALHRTFLEMAHDENNHAGIDRTYAKLAANFYLKGCSKIVKEYIDHCQSCITNKPPKFAPSGKLVGFRRGERFRRG